MSTINLQITNVPQPCIDELNQMVKDFAKLHNIILPDKFTIQNFEANMYYFSGTSRSEFMIILSKVVSFIGAYQLARSAIEQLKGN